MKISHRTKVNFQQLYFLQKHFEYVTTIVNQRNSEKINDWKQPTRQQKTDKIQTFKNYQATDL